MAKNLYYKNVAPPGKKGSHSHEASPMYATTTKKDPNQCFQPAELDAYLKLSSKTDPKRRTTKALPSNIFINNLNAQINVSHISEKKKLEPFSASVAARRHKRHLSGIPQKEQNTFDEQRIPRVQPISKTPQTSFDATLDSHMPNGNTVIRKNPLDILQKQRLEGFLTNKLAQNSHIPNFKGTDPRNKFTSKIQSQLLSQIDGPTRFKKPYDRNQKSFDIRAGTINKFDSFINSFAKAPATANNSPREEETEKKPELNVPSSRNAPERILEKTLKMPLYKDIGIKKDIAKTPLIITKHRGTPSFDVTKRSEISVVKTMTPPVLDRKGRRSMNSVEKIVDNLDLSHRISYRFAIRTRAGVAPNGARKTNQDSFVFHTNFGKKADRYLLGVCDGHGLNGHLVSGFVKENLPIYLLADPAFETNVELAFTNAFELCLQRLLVCDFDCKFSGTTASFALIDGTKIITANAGDSRAIMSSQNNKIWDYKELTQDHKPDLPHESQRIHKAGGRIEPFRDMQGNFVGPSRVWLSSQQIPGLAMSRSIGDFVAASVGVSYVPEIKEFMITPNDRFIIIASDGVWEFIKNIDVVKMVAPYYEKNDIEGACESLLGAAVKRWQEEEEVVVDDITLIIGFF